MLQKYDLPSTQKQFIQPIFNLFGSQNSPLKHGTFVIVDGQTFVDFWCDCKQSISGIAQCMLIVRHTSGN